MKFHKLFIPRTHVKLLTFQNMSISFRREFDEMMAAKMVELGQQKESIAKNKLDTENKKIRCVVKRRISNFRMLCTVSSVTL